MTSEGSLTLKLQREERKAEEGFSWPVTFGKLPPKLPQRHLTHSFSPESSSRNGFLSLTCPKRAVLSS